MGDILGRGGMGVVYKARHLRLNRPVAVKMMLNGGFAGPPELARFQREAEALAALEHPNIVRVYDVGEYGGLPYFTMEFLDGGNLAQKLGGIPQPARSAAALMVLLAGAVEVAHRGGIVHRDLKPANILLTAGGTPKITDFGLARRFEDGIGLSMTGARIGTPGYMSPELAAGNARISGPATDVYALGAVLYEMLTGRPPFHAETVAETERQVIAEEPVPTARLNARVPRDLETICLKCLQKEPRRRYSSAAALGEDLERFLRGEPIEARPVGWIERAAKWMRRHPAQAVTMFAGLTFSVAMVVGGWWLISARSLVTYAIEDDLRVATQALRRSDWGEARSALERARGRLGSGEYGELRRRVDQAGRDQDLVGRLAAIRMDRLYRIKEGFAHWALAYEKAFRPSGLLEMDERPQAAADRIRASEARDALLAAVDDWALCATQVAGARGENWELAARREAWLLDVVRKTDPDPHSWRDRLREPSVRRDKKELARLVSSARIAETQVNLLVSLGEMLQSLGGDAAPFLLSVQRHHPDDLWVNTLLGYYSLKRDDTAEAIQKFEAALETRPEAATVYHTIGMALARLGWLTEAITYYMKAVHLVPENAILRSNYGDCPADAGRLDEAAEQFERGLESTQVASTRLSIRKKLLRSRLLSGHIDKVDAIWRRSLEAKPPNHEEWDGYAEFCLYHCRQDEYHAICRGLIEHFGSTDDAQVAERTSRACLSSPASGEMLGAATTLIDFALADKKPKPEWVHSYFMLAKGLAEYRHGRLESTIAIMDGSARWGLQPAPRLVAAMARHQLGRKEEALSAFAAAVLLCDWRKTRADDREKWIYHVLRREAEAMMLPNLQAFLAGNYRPRTKDEKICLLGVCQFEGRYRAAAQIYSEVLASDADLANNPKSKHRYLAACAAASVGAGRGHDAGGLDESERLHWRKQARDWLRADLDLARELLESNAAVELRESLRLTLNTCLTDPDLAGLRDPDACTGLLPSEQQDFRALCNDLRILVNRTKN